MGPKTIKRLAILISVVLVASLAIFFIQRYQVTRMAQLVLDDAEQAERDGDFDEAARIYQERLAVIPDDVDTKLEISRCVAERDQDNPAAGTGSSNLR